MRICLFILAAFIAGCSFPNEQSDYAAMKDVCSRNEHHIQLSLYWQLASVQDNKARVDCIDQAMHELALMSKAVCTWNRNHPGLQIDDPVGGPIWVYCQGALQAAETAEKGN